MPSFTQWLKRQHRRQDAIGDLARDVRSDDEWPRCRTVEGFRCYLEEERACPGALVTLTRAWAEWAAAFAPEAEPGAGKGEL